MRIITLNHNKDTIQWRPRDAVICQLFYILCKRYIKYLHYINIDSANI